MSLDPDDDIFLGALAPYELGARRAASGRRSMSSVFGAVNRRSRDRLRNNAMSWASPYRPGIQVTDGALLPIAFSPFSFVAATGTNAITQVANPQTPFRGQRISAQVLRNGASALATAPVLNQLLVGPKPTVLTTPGPALETFSAGAFDTNLILPPTYPGMTYTMSVNVQVALAGTDTLLALVSIIGTSVL
jgi:hypothetical protein